MNLMPTKIFFVKGVGVAREELTSFELALRRAGIAPFNLVNVSSIFPPNCKKISREEGLEYLEPGQIVHCVMSRNKTNEPNRLLAASIGCAIPSEANRYGYISEHHSFGQKEKDVSDYVEDLAASMLAMTLGIKFDPAKAWDKRREIYKMSGKIIRTTSVAQSARGNKNGLWTTVLAVAVFVLSSEP